MNGSPKFTLNKEDFKRWEVTLLKLILGMIITYFCYSLAKADFGQFTPLVVAFWTSWIDLGYRWARCVPSLPERLRKMNP